MHRLRTLNFWSFIEPVGLKCLSSKENKHIVNSVGVTYFGWSKIEEAME